MPTYTEQDVLNKIEDISTNLQSCFTAIEAKGVTVPADSSLDDLGNLIRAIDSSHPDYPLSFLIADGSHGFILPTRSNFSSNNTFSCRCKLLYPTKNDEFLGGCEYVLGDSSLGMGLFLSKYANGLAARFNVFGVDGANSNPNSYYAPKLNLSNNFPFHKFLLDNYEIYQSVTTRKVTLFNTVSTVTGTGTQSSSSVWPAICYGVFGGACMDASNGNISIVQCAERGVLMIDCSIFTGPWSSKTKVAGYKPILHWDSSNNKYRPCWIDDDRKWVSTYAIAEGDSAEVNSNIDGCYYVDPLLGLEYTPVYWIDSSVLYEFKTDISHASCGLYFFDWYYQGVNYTGDILYNYDYDTNNNFTLSQTSTFNLNVDNNDYSFLTPSSEHDYLVRIPTVSSLNGEAIYGWLDVVTAGRTKFTGLTYSNSRSGYLAFKTGSDGTHPIGVNNLIIYNDSYYITHYLVLCKQTVNNVTDYVFYDCITKKIYHHE